MNVELGWEAEYLDQVPEAELRRVAGLLGESGCKITFHGPFWDLCPGSTDSRIREVARFRLEQTMAVVPFFQPSNVVCHSGFDPRHHNGQMNAYLERSLDMWEPLVAEAERLGTRILVENVWEPDPTFHRHLFERLPSPAFGFCLDVGHQNAFARAPLMEWVDTLSDQMMEIHVHDNDGSDDAHWPVGQGQIDFEALFRRLRQKGCTPLLTLEPHRREHVEETLIGLSRVSGVPVE